MAGLGRKVFTAGDVLTASDVQNYLMDQTVMNFAGTAARSSAIATPTTGMTTYNQTTQQLESYNGSAFIGMSGLQLIKKQTIGSGVSSVIVTSAFSATYTNYLITVNDTAISTTNDSIAVQMRTGTTTNTANYNYGLIFVSYAGALSNAVTSNGSSFNNVGRSLTAGDKITFGFNLFSPFLASKTLIHTLGTIGSDITGTGTGFHNTATSFDQFVLTPLFGGTMTGGTVNVYGYGV